MNAKKSIILAAMGLVMAGASITAASAETPWGQNHPQRVEVNSRLAAQDVRIKTERRDGDITPAKAARLHRADYRIRMQERRFARHHNGHITRAEKVRLNHEENRVGRHIG